MGEALNSYLDKLIRSEVYVLHRSWSTFRLCGYTGLAMAILLAMTLVTRVGLSHWIMAGVMLAAVLTFFVLAMTVKIITGEENLTYYHHEIAVIVIAAVLLSVLHQPILRYLDISILGIGMFLVCGRVGCLMAGCCHGQVRSWGVRYREEHAAVGFTSCYVGVRLIPVQALELLYAFSIVLIGSAMVLVGRPPGEALAWYVVSYGVGRFFLEFLRGDASRRYLWGFSEAQWISLLLMSIVVWEAMSGNLPFHAWYAGTFACLALAMIGVALTRRLRRTATHKLLHPRHVKEIAEAIRLDSRLATGKRDSSGDSPAYPDVHVSSTSLGIQISAGRVEAGAGSVKHYALSCQHSAMPEETARSLARLILQLRGLSVSGELVSSGQGIFHFLIHSATGTEPASTTAATEGAVSLKEHLGTIKLQRHRVVAE
jgi:hypothetical protein